MTLFLLGVALLQTGCGRPDDEVPDEDIDLVVPKSGRYEVVEFEFLDWPCDESSGPTNEIYIKDVHARVVDRRLFLTWGPQWIDENGEGCSSFDATTDHAASRSSLISCAA